LAIETYRIRLPGRKSAVECGWRELEVLVKLYHPCIIEFQSFFPGDSREGFKIATVYADGGPLKEVFCSHAFNEQLQGLRLIYDTVIRKIFIEIDGSDHNEGIATYWNPSMHGSQIIRNVGKAVFSFGLILYETVVRKAVFSEKLDPPQLMYRVLKGTRAPIPGCIPGFVLQMISKCCDGDPSDIQRNSGYSSRE
jgi:serine/threonine protein kinase